MTIISPCLWYLVQLLPCQTKLRIIRPRIYSHFNNRVKQWCQQSQALVYTSLVQFGCEILFTSMTLSRISSWNLPVLRIEGKCSFSRKQRKSVMEFELTTDRLRVRPTPLASLHPPVLDLNSISLVIPNVCGRDLISLHLQQHSHHLRYLNITSIEQMDNDRQNSEKEKLTGNMHMN